MNINGTVLRELLPTWSIALVEAGSRFSQKISADPDQNWTLALGLPRINYAAAFLSLGTLLHNSVGADEETELERLAGLVGQSVSFNDFGKTNLGKLVEAPRHPNDYATIATKVGHAAKKLGQVRNSESKLPRSKWPTIKPYGRDVNLGVHIKGTQINQAKAMAKDFRKVSSILGPATASWILGTGHTVASIYGNKSRIEEELTESIFENDQGSVSLSDLLHPSTERSYENTHHVRVLSDREEATSQERLLILESNSHLEDTLQATSGTNRIVILSRNSYYYQSASESISRLFMNRINEDTVTMDCLPTSIHQLLFSHS